MENRFWVAITVCTILGLGAVAAGFLTKLYSNVETIATARQRALDAIKEGAPEIVKAAAATNGVLPKLSVGASGDGCEVTGARQLCWGTHDKNTDAKGEIPAGDSFTFVRPFKDGTQPSVTMSVKNITHNGSSADYGVLAINVYSQSTTGIDYHTFSSFNPPGPMTVSVSYVALGFAQPPK
jgi:hypothetical protein